MGPKTIAELEFINFNQRQYLVTLRKLGDFVPTRLDFRRSLMSGVCSSWKRDGWTHERQSNCPWHTCKLIILFMGYFWLLEMAGIYSRLLTLYNLDRSMGHLQLERLVQLPFFFKKVLVLPILFHINAAEGHSILCSQKKLLLLSKAKPFDCGGV